MNIYINDFKAKGAFDEICKIIFGSLPKSVTPLYFIHSPNPENLRSGCVQKEKPREKEIIITIP